MTTGPDSGAGSGDHDTALFRRASRIMFSLLVLGVGAELAGFARPVLGVSFILGGTIQAALSLALVINFRNLLHRLGPSDFPPGIYFAPAAWGARRRVASANWIAGWFGLVISTALLAVGVTAL